MENLLELLNRRPVVEDSVAARELVVTKGGWTGVSGWVRWVGCREARQGAGGQRGWVVGNGCNLVRKRGWSACGRDLAGQDTEPVRSHARGLWP